MNYKYHYNALIERAQTRILDCYIEKHHIIPRCMKGTDDKDNIVALTAREHFIAHLLLMKIYPKHLGLAKAAMMLCVIGDGQNDRINNRRYEWLKIKHSKSMSESQSGIKNSNYGKRWIYSDELKISKQLLFDKELPLGWIEGRKIKFDVVINYCEHCHIELHDVSKKTKFCSKKCKSLARSNITTIIDDNLQDIIEVFKETHSINKTLTQFGIINRKGNSYLSAILKDLNFKILNRRNSNAP